MTHPSSFKNIEMPMQETNIGDHFLSPQQLEMSLRTNIVTGLTHKCAAQRLQRYGPNVLKILKDTSYCKLFCRNLCGWFQIMLWAGAVVNYAAYFFCVYLQDASDDTVEYLEKEYLYLAIMITATFVGTGLFGFYQAMKNEAVTSGLEKFPPATVIREGMKKVIPNSKVVLGDLIEMSSGDVVPADVRLLTCQNFKTDMASLTGESKSVVHSTEYTHSKPLESKNMAYFSCLVTDGTAKGVVVATGEMTQIGKIAKLGMGLRKKETPITKETTYVIALLCGVGFFLGFAFFALVYFTQKSWKIALRCMLGIILANMPEGLVVTLTICMTLSAKQLKKNNCLAKRLQAVETLGSISCICADKTGTLTINKMTVSHLFCNFTIYDKRNRSHVSNTSFSELCVAASLNLNASFTDDSMHMPIQKRKVLGDATEAAILRFMEENRSATKIQKNNPKVLEIPFNSVDKYQITIHQMMATRSYYLIMKGAPEIVLAHCKNVLTEEGIKPISPKTNKELMESFIKLANMGERVIGYCIYKLPLEAYPLGYQFDQESRNFPMESLTFVGAVAMFDPPREEVRGAIALCKQAGIKVSMVTGDHPVTALAISRQVGTITMPTVYDYAFEHHIDVSDVPLHIKSQFKSIVIVGDELRKMTACDLRVAMNKYMEITFARTSPQQKLFIVENYQALKHVVAVTGDGVNDSPALRKADIGIAMGVNGSEVSKKAADVILLDDNFASIVHGVREGRRIFYNLKKTIAYTLTSNAPEMLPFVLYACLEMPLPMTLILILIINIGTDILPALSLAYETSEQDIMKIPPRNLRDHLVSGVLIYMTYFQVGLIQFCGAMYAYFVVFAKDGFYPSYLFFSRHKWYMKSFMVPDTYGRIWVYEDRMRLERKAQTAYFVAVCMTQISDVIICKTRRISLLNKGMYNHVLNVSILVVLTTALIVTYVPYCQDIFSTEALDVHDFILALPFMVLIIFADELRRFIMRSQTSKWIERETCY